MFGDVLTLHVAITEKGGGVELVFFARNIIINHTDLRFSFNYEATAGRRTVAGQRIVGRKFALADETKYLSMTMNGRHSKKFSVKNAGLKDQIELRSDNMRTGTLSLYELVYQTTLSLALYEEYIYTKIVSIFPLWVVINKLGDSILFGQNTQKDLADFIEPGERLAFYWADASAP